MRRLRNDLESRLGSDKKNSTRFITIFEHLSIVLFLGIQCLPECGEERLLVLVLSVIGTMVSTHLPACHSDLVTCHSANSLASIQVQTTQTLSLKYEEAHVISLVDNATNIIVSFLLQVREAPFCNMCLAFDPSCSPL